MRRSVFACACLVLIAAASAAQVAPLPPRDRPLAPAAPAGTGAIKGRVVDGQTGNAVVRARVRLMGSGPRQPVVLTDESGAFAFAALPRGSYSVMVDKATYVSGRYPDGGQTFRTSARPIELADGQRVDGITVTIFRGGVIAGHVVDAHGDPVEGASVQAVRLPRTGRGRPQTRTSGSTNDIGEFRLPHLEPGKYLILVMPRRDMFNDMMSASDTDPVEYQPAPTYYPGVQSMDQAQPIALERGASVGGVEFTLVDGPAAVVSGTVVDASGQPVTRGASITVRPLIPGLPGYGFGSGTGVRPDGTFRLRLSPGEYELEARIFEPSAGSSSGREHFGGVHVTVNGDVSGLMIQLGPGATLSGRILFEGTSALPSSPSNPGQMQLVTGSPDAPTCRTGRAELAPDFTFTVDGVFGTCTVRLNGPFGRWSVKSIVYRGNDLLDQPVTFGTGQRLRDIQVTLTDKRTEVTMQVADERGQPTREYVGLLFSVDKARWTVGSRYIRPLVPRPDPPAGSVGAAGAPSAGFSAGGVTSTPGSSGGPPPRPDTIAGLPPGEYFAVAVDDLDSELMRDGDVLERLSRGARRVTLSEDAKIDVSLRRVKLSDLIADR